MSGLKRVNPYAKTTWLDRIVDVTTGQVLQEGTRFNQRRANNIEEGIYGAYEYAIELESIVKRLQAQLEIDGRVPNNNGSYYDVFDGNATRLIRLMEITDVTAAVEVGETVISVADASIFTPMTYVTIYDADCYEHVRVTDVDVAAKTISVDAIENAYDKGAKIARSTASVDAVNQTLDVAPFVTYDVELVEVV